MCDFLKLILFTLIFVDVLNAHADSNQFELENLNNLYSDSTLIDPQTIYPIWRQIDSDTRKLLFAELTCGKIELAQMPTKKSLLKLREWVYFRCKHTEKLNPNFFSTMPFLHPSGASYVALAWQMLQFKHLGSQWLNQHWQKSHLLELNELIPNMTDYSSEIKIISELNPDNLSQLLRGEEKITLVHYQLIKKNHSGLLHYQIQELKLKSWLDSTWFWVLIAGTITSLFVVSIWLGLKLLRTRLQIQKDRELMMQTLAHELRHPVTSLQLSMESYRNLFDQLPTLGQDEFLRMTGQIQRLFRIIQASTQYLHSSKANTFKLDSV